MTFRDEEHALRWMNERYAEVQVPRLGRRILRGDELVRIADARNWLSNRRLPSGRPVFNWWLRHPGRRVARPEECPT